jgi:DNA polymerase-3 subunit epsilon
MSADAGGGRRLAERLGRWLGTGHRPTGTRWLVVDVETTGLDPHSDELLAIAAVAVDVSGVRPAVLLHDSIEILLRPAERPGPPDRTNVLLHGIGIGAQRVAPDPALGLAAWSRFVDGAPLAGFHVGFDRAVIERAQRRAGLPAAGGPWLDLSPLAAALHPEVSGHGLDDWLTHFGIRCVQRHHAAADALATAELLLRLWPALARDGVRPDFARLRRLTEQRRWLGR